MFAAAAAVVFVGRESVSFSSVVAESFAPRTVAAAPVGREAQRREALELWKSWRGGCHVCVVTTGVLSGSFVSECECWSWRNVMLVATLYFSRSVSLMQGGSKKSECTSA